MSFVLNFEMVSWGKIVFGPPSDYVGGSVTEFLEVNELEIARLALDYVPHVMDSGVGGVGRESFTSFNEVQSPNPNFGSSNHPTEHSSPLSEHFSPSSQHSNPLGEPSNTSSQPSNLLSEPSNTSYQPSNPIVEPSNLKYRDFRASRRHFNRSNKRTIGTTTEQIHTIEKGLNIGYDETNVGSNDRLLGKLRGDEPYYPSDEAPSF
ncbi:hypothetical protein KY285_023630 [Solanum tuberosum]|nr:hypothetical protein KY289_023962 [Solanum tuberosum]KAH0675829.1 hypothetical protein KY285_023630 [Solanum tuberosum]